MKKQGRGRKTAAVKVVYISSPMKVKTSASKFRALVQELTGRESDVARYMEMKEREASKKVIAIDDGGLSMDGVDHSSSSSDQSVQFHPYFDMDAFLSSSFLYEQFPPFDGMTRRFEGV